MSFDALKQPAYAIAAEVTLTPDGPQAGQVVVVRDGKITAITSATNFKADGLPLVELPGHAVIPGMVDAHTHAGQTFGKTLICGEPSQIWRRLWLPLEDSLNPQRSYVAAKWMFLEALRGGFTTLVNFNRNDVENNEAVHQAAEDIGIRLVSGVAASTASPSAAAVIDDLKQHTALCAKRRTITPSLCFGFYGATMEGLKLEELASLGRFCADNGILLQMHSNEHFPDVHDCIVRYGKRPIELWDELGLLNRWTLLHHVTLVTAHEIDLLQQRNAGVSYNPVASQWKGNAVAPALQYAERGLRMGLGTDATRMDGFRNMDAAENCQRIAHGMSVLDFSCGAGWTWVEAATAGGADAAGLASVTGKLATGKAADFLILDMNAPEVVPSWDFEWELVRGYNRDQIRAVVVNGRLVMQDGKGVGWDSVAFVREQEQLARDMVKEAGVTRVHGASPAYRAAKRHG